MKISIIGAGYVGLVTAAVFSELGNDVCCVDISVERIAGLQKNKIPFFEPELEEYVKRSLKSNRLTFTTDYAELKDSEIIFICVGTPPGQNGQADLTSLFSALRQTAKNIKDHTLIVIKSTFPIGFENELETLVKENTNADFEFAACPEFLREGTAMHDALNPDRIVLGTNSKKAQEVLLVLHDPLPGKRIICDMRSAQLIKYAANSFLATKISFANALAIICEKTGANVETVLEGVSADKRIGSSYFKPGIGYGGSCLPKDVMAFIAQASSVDYNFELLNAVNSINNSQVDYFIDKIRNAVDPKGRQKNLAGKNLAILGLSFKPETDDLREAPSIKIIGALQKLKANITAYDPKTIEAAGRILKDIQFATDVYSAARGKDAIILVTEWPEFLEMDLSRIKLLLKTPIIIDGRNMFDRQKMKDYGFQYHSVGR